MLCMQGKSSLRVTRAEASRVARPGQGFRSVAAFPGTPRRACATNAVAAAAGQRLMLHIGETTIGLPFTAAQGAELDAALKKLLQTFVDKQKAERPRRWDMMEVRFTGDASEAGPGASLELFEVFCNPNAHATAFEAKLLLTVKAGPISVTTEGRLPAVRADLDAFLDSSGAAR